MPDEDSGLGIGAEYEEALRLHWAEGRMPLNEGSSSSIDATESRALPLQICHDHQVHHQSTCSTARIDSQPHACLNLRKHFQSQPGQQPRHAENHHTQPPMPAATKPLQATSNWKPQAQTEEQVAEGLRDAFRQAVREGVVTPQSDQRRGS